MTTRCLARAAREAAGLFTKADRHTSMIAVVKSVPLMFHSFLAEHSAVISAFMWVATPLSTALMVHEIDTAAFSSCACVWKLS